MSEPAYAWFWQPPINGQPGLLMIQDEHPGPAAIDVPMVLECLSDTLLVIEQGLPKEISFHQLRIFIRDPLGTWCQAEFNALSRHYNLREPQFTGVELANLWASRETRPLVVVH